MQHSRASHFGYQNNADKNHFFRVMFHRRGGWGTARAVFWMVYDESHQHLGVAASLSPLKTTSWGRIAPGSRESAKKDAFIFPPYDCWRFHLFKLIYQVDMQYATCNMTPTWGNVVTGHLAEPGVLRCVALAWHWTKKQQPRWIVSKYPLRMSFFWGEWLCKWHMRIKLNNWDDHWIDQTDL